MVPINIKQCLYKNLQKSNNFLASYGKCYHLSTSMEWQEVPFNKRQHSRFWRWCIGNPNHTTNNSFIEQTHTSY